MLSNFKWKLFSSFLTALVFSLSFTLIAFEQATSQFFTFPQLLFIVFILTFFPTFIAGTVIGNFIDQFLFRSPQYWISYLLLGILFAYLVDISIYHTNGMNLLLFLVYGIICATLYASIRYLQITKNSNKTEPH